MLSKYELVRLPKGLGFGHKAGQKVSPSELWARMSPFVLVLATASSPLRVVWLWKVGSGGRVRVIYS